MKRFSTLIMLMFVLLTSQNITAKNTQPKVNNEEKTGMRYATKQPDPDFKFEVAEITIDIADESNCTLPKLLNPNKLEVEQYATSDSELITVDEEGNFKIITIIPGEVSIYAKSKRNAKFLETEAECLVHIINSNLISSVNFGTDKNLKREGEGGWYEDSAISIWEINQTSWWAYGAYKLNKHNVAYLISPLFTLDGAEAFQVEFEHSCHYAEGHKQDTQLVIREKGKEWTVIEGVKYPEVGSYAKVSSGKVNVPADFTGKTVEFGFKYTAEGTNADSNWNIWSFKLLKSNGTSSGIYNIEKPAIKNDKIYDLQGRIVKNPTKGIYIINGKKILIK